MGIAVEQKLNGRALEFTLSGVIHGADIIKAHKIHHTPAILANLEYKIIDKSQVTENYISNDEIKEILELELQLAEKKPNLLTAIIVGNVAISMSSTIYEGYAQDHKLRTKSFNKRIDAEKWISEQLRLLKKPQTKNFSPR